MHMCVRTYIHTYTHPHTCVNVSPVLAKRDLYSLSWREIQSSYIKEIIFVNITICVIYVYNTKMFMYAISQRSAFNMIKVLVFRKLIKSSIFLDA